MKKFFKGLWWGIQDESINPRAQGSKAEGKPERKKWSGLLE